MDLALDNLQRLICHKTQQTKAKHLNKGYQDFNVSRERYITKTDIIRYYPLGN